MSNGPPNLVRLSTADVPSSEKMSYWVDGFSATILKAECVPHRSDEFEAQLAYLRSPPLAIARCIASGRTVVPSELNESVYLISEFSDDWIFSENGKTHRLRPNDVALIDGRHSRRTEYALGSDHALVELPPTWAARWLPELHRSNSRVISRDRGWGRVLSVLCQELAEDLEILSDVDCDLLASHIGDLVSAFVTEPTRPSGKDKELIARADSEIRARLANPLLSLEEIANAFGMSPRSISRLFARNGTTFSALVRLRRLELAYDLIMRPSFRFSGVEDLAIRCGFLAAAHFAREFRKQWGVTPSRLRRQHQRDSAAHEKLRRRVDLEHAIEVNQARVKAQEERVALLPPGSYAYAAASQLLEQMRVSLENLRKTCRSL